MDTINSGQTYSTSLPDGKAVAMFQPPKPGKYVFLPSGAAALVGVYEGTVAIGANGKLQIPPGEKRGVRTLAAVPHLITITGAGPGQFTLLVRPWSFWDYFG